MNFNEDIKQQVLHTMLYILNKLEGVSDFHKLFKIMYFAERKHIARYGRMITGDDYIKMDNGPVPSLAYNILKDVKYFSKQSVFSPYLDVFGRYMVKSLKEYNSDEFSNSDIECLNESIEENKELSFGQLTDKSHDNAWEYASFSLSINDMAEVEGATAEMLDYIKEMQELKKTSFFVE